MSVTLITRKNGVDKVVATGVPRKAKMSEPKLKPCPFCGNTELHTEPCEGEIIEVAVRCEDCGAYGPWMDSVAGAKEQWNRRTP